MLVSLAEILADVRSLINEPTEDFWDDDEIERWILEGSEDFSTRTKLLSSYYSKTLEATDIVNDREIRLNSDFVAFDEGGVLYNDTPLIQTSLKQLDEWVGNWRDTTGTPTRFYFRGDYLGFYPKPSAGDEVKYYGIERAPTLTGSVVPLNSDYRVIALRRYLRDYAVAMCWYKKNEMQKYADMMARYEMGIMNAQSVVSGHKNQGAQMIPGYRTKGSRYSIRYGRTDIYD